MQQFKYLLLFGDKISMQEENRRANIEYLPYKLASFCTHRTDKAAAPYVDVICNRREDLYHRVSQPGKICNKCAPIISKSAKISNDCLYCLDKIENYLEQVWICGHRNAIYEQITIKCIDNREEIHEVPFKSKVCQHCYDKIRAAFMYSSKCVVCAEKENEMFEDIEKTITLPAHYFFDLAIKEIESSKMSNQEARQEIENYCLAEPRHTFDSKFQKIADSIGDNQKDYHLSKRYQLYPKCQKHRNNPVSLCNNCLVAILNVDSCPYGCPYQKAEKKPAKGEEGNVSQGGFVYFYPKEGKDRPYLEYFIFRQIEEFNKLDRWEGRIKKVKLSSKCPVPAKDKFTLYASVAQVSKDVFLYSGGAEGPTIDSLKTSNKCFLVNFTADRKEFLIEDIANMSEARSSHASITLGGHVYIIGGFNKEKTQCLNSCERFDIGSGKWSQIAAMNVERSKPTVFIHHGQIYVIGGMSPNQDYYSQICEKFNPETNQWTTISYDGYDIPCVSGATVLNQFGDRQYSEILIAGGSDLNASTYMVQTLTIDPKGKTFEMNQSGTRQRLEYSRLNASACMMNTEKENEKIALIFGGLQEHEPMMSLDGVRIKYSKGQNGDQMIPFFIYDDIQVGSYRLLLRESAATTYEYMMERLLEQKILSKEKLSQDNQNPIKSQFNIHMIEKMWYGVGKCLMPLTM